MYKQPGNGNSEQSELLYSQPQPQPSADSVFCWCSTKVLCFLAILLAFTLGLIVGALLAIVVIVALPALIVLAVVLAILIIALLIFRFCNCCKSRRCD